MAILKAFDTAESTLDMAHKLKARGFQCVGLYLRGDRTPPASIRGLHDVGIGVFSIWEEGFPTSGVYFSAGQGTLDGKKAAAFASSVLMPAGKPIFTCYDFDPTLAEIEGPLSAYAEAFHGVVKDAGYLAGGYGSGLCGAKLVAAGFAHCWYLSGSTRFAGYKEALGQPWLAIKQCEEGVKVCGLDADLDTVLHPDVTW